MASAPLERSGMAAANPRAVAPAPGARFALIDWRDCEDALTLAEWDELAQSVSEPNPFCESWNLLPALGGFARAGEVVHPAIRKVLGLAAADPGKTSVADSAPRRRRDAPR